MLSQISLCTLFFTATYNYHCGSSTSLSEVKDCKNVKASDDCLKDTRLLGYRSLFLSLEAVSQMQ